MQSCSFLAKNPGNKMFGNLGWLVILDMNRSICVCTRLTYLVLDTVTVRGHFQSPPPRPSEARILIESNLTRKERKRKERENESTPPVPPYVKLRVVCYCYKAKQYARVVHCTCIAEQRTYIRISWATFSSRSHSQLISKQLHLHLFFSSHM